MGWRECHRADGKPKKRYATRARAKRARVDIRLAHENSDPGQPYRCSICDWFHLGHYPSSREARQRLKSRHRR